jgi:hypothetical protein
MKSPYNRLCMTPAINEVNITPCQWNILQLVICLPMENIHDPVEPQKQDIMRRDILHLFESGDHRQLWEDGHGLEPHRERPHEVDGVEGFVDDDGHGEGAKVQEVVVEVVLGGRVRLKLGQGVRGGAGILCASGRLCMPSGR